MKGLKLFCQWYIYIFIILYQCYQAAGEEICYKLSNFQIDLIDDDSIGNAPEGEICREEHYSSYHINDATGECQLSFEKSQVQYKFMDSETAMFTVKEDSGDRNILCNFKSLGEGQLFQMEIQPLIDRNDVQVFAIEKSVPFDDTETSPNNATFLPENLTVFVKNHLIGTTYTFREKEDEERRRKPYLIFSSGEFHLTRLLDKQTVLYLTGNRKRRYILHFNQEWHGEKFVKALKPNTFDEKFVEIKEKWKAVLLNASIHFENKT